MDIIEEKDKPKESLVVGTGNEKIELDISPEERNSTIDKYLMGEPIEKTYTLLKKGDKELSFTVRVVSAELMEYADKLLFDKEDISMAEAIMENNNNLIGVQIIRFMKKDFLKDQSDNYATKEGVIERVVYMKKQLILPIRALVIEKMRHFQAWSADIFSQESLKNF